MARRATITLLALLGPMLVALGCAGARRSPAVPPQAAPETPVADASPVGDTPQEAKDTIAEPVSPEAAGSNAEEIRPAVPAGEETVAPAMVDGPEFGAAQDRDVAESGAADGAAVDSAGAAVEAEVGRETERARLTREERQRLREQGPCSQLAPEGEPALEATRRHLYQTVCGAVTWFDGLFGESRGVEIAKRTSGRVELSFVESEYHGFKVRARFHARVRFPNIEERFEAFVGRDDEDQFVEDRPEGFGIRSQFHSFEEDDRWVAGLGYGLPGSYAKRTDFRLGGRGGRTPEIFAQGRHRRNWFVGDRVLWHFRETLFWTNRDGFGTTTSLDFDRIMAPRVLLRVGGVGTFSEETDGLSYRLVGVVYQNLSLSGRALSYELFARGETDDEVRLGEYGLRLILRRPVLGKPWLFGELIGGYSWIRERFADPRRGSYSIGFGIDLFFGQGDPYSR